MRECAAVGIGLFVPTPMRRSAYARGRLRTHTHSEQRTKAAFVRAHTNSHTHTQPHAGYRPSAPMRWRTVRRRSVFERDGRTAFMRRASEMAVRSCQQRGRSPPYCSSAHTHSAAKPTTTHASNGASASGVIYGWVLYTNT